MTGYYAPKGGLPPQTSLMTGRAVFTDAYAFIPRGRVFRYRDQPAAGLGQDPRLDHRTADVGLFRNLQPICDGGGPRWRLQHART